jgi:hypothetical protein
MREPRVTDEYITATLTDAENLKPADLVPLSTIEELNYLMDEPECRALLSKAVREEKAYLQTMLLMIQKSAKGLPGTLPYIIL